MGHEAQPGAFGAPGHGYCPECGNKRCPKATWHAQACSHSNAPGQIGSIYGKPPMELLKIWMKDDDA